jgi:nicotinamide riboside kinase
MSRGKIVNCYGGPGCGKSTLAAELYAILKRQQIDVEYVNEYAKELVYQKNAVALSDQILVFANQYHRLWTAAEHNAVVITDSPLLLSTIYNPDTSPHFKQLILEMDQQFTSLNLVLKRSHHVHSMVGRIHSLTESISIDNRIRALLQQNQIDYVEYDSLHDDIHLLAKLVRQEYQL